jgi:FkbM family methyltransferase
VLTDKRRGAALRLARLLLAAAQPAGLSALRRGVPPERLLRYRQVSAFHGLDVRTVLYVGANRGQELPLLLTAFPAAHVHCFEPAPATAQDLERAWGTHPRVTVWRFALADRDGEAAFNTSASHDQANSLRPPDEAMDSVWPGVDGWSSETIAVRRLDGWWDDAGVRGDVVLKMDVQGAEDLVLRGAGRRLEEVRAVITELAVTPTYVGAPRAEDVHHLLRDAGFRYGGSSTSCGRS